MRGSGSNAFLGVSARRRRWRAEHDVDYSTHVEMLEECGWSVCFNLLAHAMLGHSRRIGEEQQSSGGNQWLTRLCGCRSEFAYADGVVDSAAVSGPQSRPRVLEMVALLEGMKAQQPYRVESP